MRTLRKFLQRVSDWARDADDSYLYQLSLNDVQRTAPPPHPQVQQVACDAQNLTEVLSRIPNLHPLIVHFVRQGHVAYLATAADQCIFRSVAILGPRTYRVHGYPLVLTREQVYLEAAETHPDWRGQGVAPGMLQLTAGDLLARGYAQAFMTINIDNSASCRAAEKGGARRLGQIDAQRYLGQWHACYTSLPVADMLREP